MKYQTGRVGRTFVVRFEDKDKFLESVVELARKEKIRSAVFFAVGGITEAKIVVGPEKEELPPNPVWRELAESHEAVGIGTIFWQGDEPKIHFHGAFGKKDSVKVGCLREAADTFIVLEAVILEIEGIDAVRALDALSNMVLLKL
jgi:predicted DNA-binding protein with PD1-like motif